MRRRAGRDALADSPVARALRQRGLDAVPATDPAGTFLTVLRTARDRDRFHDALRSYAFRLFLRDLLVLRDRSLPERLGPFFTPGSVAAMTALAGSLGILARRRDGGIRLRPERAVDFGPTYEWFVAELLRRDFGADVLRGVAIPGLPCGGDFDVLALLSGRLLYVETKTSPPKHIEAKDVAAFLARVRALSPDIAVLLVDTHLRMKDKLVPLLDGALEDVGVRGGGMERVEKETFARERRLFVTNAKRDVAANLALCLRTYFLDRFFG